MVGKGEAKNSRIFHQCYVKCCKLQNMTPLAAVLPTANGSVLDFCVDRVKYAEWPPILNALSCDLSLHAVSVRCRQPVKTILEHIDCERLAKTVNKRAVILTKFMLSNLVEATAQLLGGSTLLTSLLLEGLPLKIPYLNPLCEACLANGSLQHLCLPRCLIGDAGCLAVCKAVRCLPNILTLDLSGCDLTLTGAAHIADLIKYQKIHRYSENWVHTLRYRLPELDSMGGLRRITLCGNAALGDAGLSALLDVLADDLWIKALDVQGCGLSAAAGAAALLTLQSNSALLVLDLRRNDVPPDALARLRAALRANEGGRDPPGQYSWLSLASVSRCSSEGRLTMRNKDRVASTTRNGTSTAKYNNKTTNIKKEKDCSSELGAALAEEAAHRRQLERLNARLVEQLQQMKLQQRRLWTADETASEQSLAASARSSAPSSSGSSVPVDAGTLARIQHAFRDIYSFIRTHQCRGECERTTTPSPHDYNEGSFDADNMAANMAAAGNNMAPKKAQSTHSPLSPRNDAGRVKKTSKSAHHLRDAPRGELADVKPVMFEKQMGDSMTAHAVCDRNLEETNTPQDKLINVGRGSPRAGSPDTLTALRNPRDALASSDSDSDHERDSGSGSDSDESQE